MRRTFIFFFGVASYALFLAVFLYAIAFVGDLGPGPTIERGPQSSPGFSAVGNVGLLLLFALQHSGMARPRFKAWLTRAVPEAMERSVYVLASSLALALLFVGWRPLDFTLWHIGAGWARAVVWSLYAAGWLLVLGSTFLISHAHLFGVAQVSSHLRGRQLPEPGFRAPGLYRHLRHPIMLGFLIAFWAAPTMSLGRLLFAVATTGYVLLALRLEERDLVRLFGQRYERYREKVPMLVPRWKRADL